MFIVSARRVLLAAGAGLITCAALGCGADQSAIDVADHGAPAVPAGLQNSLPALPDDRHSSLLVETLIHGNATLDRSTAAADLGSALLLDSAAAASYQWGLYGFAPAAGSSLDSLNALLDVPDGSSVWLALADYSSGRWDFFGPYEDSKTLLVDDPKFLSPGGNLYCAALVADGGSATVNALSVRIINPANQAPVADLVPNKLSGDAPIQIGFDASASEDPDGQIIEYAWDWDGDNVYDGISDEDILQHNFTAPGIYKVQLRVTDDNFARAYTSVNIDITAPGNNPPTAVLGGIGTGDAPLTVNMDGSLSDAGDPGDSIVKYQWDFDGDAAFDAESNVPFATHTYTEYGSFTAVLRVTDSAGNQADSNLLNITVNAVPQAVLEVLPGSATTGEAVELSGLQSSDANGSIVDYEWDTDGNTSYDLDTNGVGHTSVSFDAPGLYTLRLRVTDNNGAQDEASATLAVHGWIAPQYVDGGQPGVGAENSLAVINGKPAIAYYDFPNTDLLYVRAQDAEGHTWGNPVRVNSVPSDSTGRWPSMKEVQGRPAIAFHDDGNMDLMYCRASDTDGTAWPASLVLDSAGDTGQYPSMQVIDGLPAVAYHQIDNLQLRYVKAQDQAGNAWDPSFILDDSGDVGAYPSLAVINGNPAVAYWDDGAGAVVYMRSSTAGGTSWPAPVHVHDVGSLNSPVWLLSVNGNPAIGHEDNSNGTQWFSRADDPVGGNWSSAVKMPDANGSPASFSMAMIDGHPAIAYFDNNGFDLKYSRAKDVNGTQWETPQTIDTQGVVGGFSSMTEVDGGIGISYYDSTFSRLKYVWGY